MGERGQVWLRLGVRLGAALLAVWLAVKLGPLLLSLFLPFLLSLLCAWALSPVVGWLCKRLGLSRRFLSFAVLLGALAALVSALWWLLAGAVEELSSLSQDWEGLVTGLQAGLHRWDAALSQVLSRLPEGLRGLGDALGEHFFSWLDTLVPRLLTQAAEGAAGAVMALPSFAVATLVFLLATYFLLTRLPHLRVSLADSLPQGVRVFLSMLKKAAGTGLGGYLKAQLLLSVAVFFLLLGGFLLIRQPYALLLAAALALLDFLPLLGAGAALAPWGVVELLSGQVRRGVGILAVWGLVALFRRLAEPKVLGDQTGLSPMLSLASVYVGMKLGGVAGMLLGPILTLVVRDLCQSGVLDGALADLRRARKDLKSLFRSSLDDFS